MKRTHRKTDWSTVATRTLLFSLLWWGLSDGNIQSWWVGAPAVLSALVISLALLPPTPLVWHELLLFILFFLWRSLQGGVDVAWRAFHPSLPVTPKCIDYPLRLPPNFSRFILVNTVSLLPGTLSARLDGEILSIHVLDGLKDFLPELGALEQRVARLSGLALTTSPEDE